MNKTTHGFTLIEVLVTVSILAILVSTVVISFGPAREQSRDAQRQTDLRTIEAALALYKNKYGVYPAGCNGPTTGVSTNWSGQAGGGYDCASGSQYIVGLAPEFLPELPTDPRLNTSVANSGYVYTTNQDQSVFKIMALNTVETEVVGPTHPFFRCDSASWNLPNPFVGVSYNDPRMCRRTPLAGASGPNVSGDPMIGSCNLASFWQTSYAISAGYSTNNRGNAGNPLKGEEYDTEIVRCG